MLSKSVRFSLITHRGHVRAENQDAILALRQVIQANMEKPVSGEVIDLPAVFAVSDGLGAHQTPALASLTVLEELQKLCDQCTSKSNTIAALETIHGLFQARIQKSQHPRPMGATCAGVSIVGSNRSILFCVGDSRVYGGRETLTQLTPDHRGREPRMVTKSFGGVRTGEALAPFAMEIEGDNRYLICTDGVTDFIDPTAIEIEDDPDRWLARLLRELLNSSCGDNFAVIALCGLGQQ